MACYLYRYVPDSPAVGWVIARREGFPEFRTMYYTGPILGWVADLDAGACWDSPEAARLIAGDFPGSVVLRVLMWEPLPIVIAPGELDDLE